jgi:hypothetical protein
MDDSPRREDRLVLSEDGISANLIAKYYDSTMHIKIK